jgi:hypothetical protein
MELHGDSLALKDDNAEKLGITLTFRNTLQLKDGN